MIDTDALRSGCTKKFPSGVYFMASTAFPIAKVGVSSSDMRQRYREHVISLSRFKSECVPLDALRESFKIVGVAPHLDQSSYALESRLMRKLDALGYQKLPVGLEWFSVPPSDHGFVLDCLGLIRLEKYQRMYGS